MIAYLSGKILKKLDRSIILNTGQVGYLVNVTDDLLSNLKENENAEFFTYTNVREDALEIFGFQSPEELNFFKKLISISGVGPKTAQEIISLPIKNLKNSILNEDPSLICTVPKVGKKIADRIILELKNKITIDEADRAHSSISGATDESVYTALEKLGYSRKQITQTLRTLPENTTDPEQIIKFFLQNA
jgi:holliday junction DNA helicase RuvA